MHGNVIDHDHVGFSLEIGLQETSRQTKTGIVDEDIDLFIFHFSCQSQAFLFSGKVSADYPVIDLQFFRQGLHLFPAAAAHDDSVSLPGISSDKFLSDTAAGAGNKYGLHFKSLLILVESSSDR